jgi:hypothetical protein
MIAVAIWNCQVLEQWGRGSHVAEQARAQLGSIPKSPVFAAMMDEMLERKANVFPQDMRAISDFKVYRNAQGELRIIAEGRLPSELMEEH